MDIVIGKNHHFTSIETEERNAAIALDVNEKLVVVLGINRVVIERTDGSWTVTNGPNVLHKPLQPQDELAFCPRGKKLSDMLP